MPAGPRPDPYGNFKFRVEIDGIVQAGFSYVKLPEGSCQVIEYREGTEATTVRKLPGRVSFSNCLLRWGLTNSQELYNWWQSVVDGNVQRRSMSIILMDASGTDVSRWNLTKAWPVRYQVSDLNAMGNLTVVETLEIACEGFELASRE